MIYCKPFIQSHTAEYLNQTQSFISTHSTTLRCPPQHHSSLFLSRTPHSDFQRLPPTPGPQKCTYILSDSIRTPYLNLTSSSNSNLLHLTVVRPLSLTHSLSHLILPFAVFNNLFVFYCAAVSIITTFSLCALALAWGLCNYGFITYVPTMLVTVGKYSTCDT